MKRKADPRRAFLAGTAITTGRKERAETRQKRKKLKKRREKEGELVAKEGKEVKQSGPLVRRLGRRTVAAENIETDTETFYEYIVCFVRNILKFSLNR